MRQRVPWGRLSAEGAVIVVSILLAFVVQAWWEARQERRLEVQRLAALRLEVVQVVEGIPDQETGLQSSLALHEALIGQFPGGSLAPGDSLMSWLGGISNPHSFVPRRVVLDDLMSSGGIQAVQSDRVRMGIAAYRQSLEQTTNRRDNSWVVLSDRILPYLEARAPESTGSEWAFYSNASDFPFAASPFATDYSGLFADRAFESMLAERWSALRLYRGRLAILEATAADLIRLIEEDLGSG